ncbi:M24 family metallopeptidase [Natronobeatus ordinarius]|uniref:M24 family metallopeptidase n=1 Tax=Natronobeatus ordinarius TaxID=2963433 RepID=UPI0020CF3E86|nr:M24 family metallopeptidase [Natronobeatus ordinarius]
MTERDEHRRAAIRAELESRDAGAFVHVGTGEEPSVAYCGVDGHERAIANDATVAVAFDGDAWLVVDEASVDGHPADRLARELRERDVATPLLTPQDVPHDAALYLEQAGFSLASSDVLERARATKTSDERDRIDRASAAASAGVRAAAAVLADATVVDGRLEAEGEAVTPERLRRTVDGAIVEAGAFPAGNTVVDEGVTSERREAAEPLRAGEPIVLEATPRGPTGYHGSLARTLVVESEGGPERRAHVAVTSALRSARAMLVGGDQPLEAVEADLEAEVRSFGFDEGVEAAVHGVGLEPREWPGHGDEIAVGSVVRLEAAVTDADAGCVRVADLLALEANGPRWLASPSRSLSPAAVVE